MKTYKFIPHDAPDDAEGIRYRVGVDDDGELRLEVLDQFGEWTAVFSLSSRGLAYMGIGISQRLQNWVAP